MFRLFVPNARAALPPFAVLALAGLASCAPDDFTQPLPDTPITADEIVAGVGDPGIDNVEPAEGIDGVNADLLAPVVPDFDNDGDETTTTRSAESTACREATGYRSGRPISICVTSVDGKLVEVHTATAYRRMQAAARSAGVSISIVSGFRTMEKQRELYNCYRAGRCPLAARPGYSNHQSGLALDLNTRATGVYRWLTNHAARYGFLRTVPSEIWHWEYRR